MHGYYRGLHYTSKVFNPLDKRLAYNVTLENGETHLATPFPVQTDIPLFTATQGLPSTGVALGLMMTDIIVGNDAFAVSFKLAATDDANIFEPCGGDVIGMIWENEYYARPIHLQYDDACIASGLGDHYALGFRIHAQAETDIVSAMLNMPTVMVEFKGIVHTDTLTPAHVPSEWAQWLSSQTDIRVLGFKLDVAVVSDDKGFSRDHDSLGYMDIADALRECQKGNRIQHPLLGTIAYIDSYVSDEVRYYRAHLDDGRTFPWHALPADLEALDWTVVPADRSDGLPF